MSENRQPTPQTSTLFRVFAGFQNYERLETQSHALIPLWTNCIYTTKLKFFATENEDEYRAYVHGNLWKTIVYSDVTQTLGLQILLLNAPITLTSFFLTNSLDIPRPFKRIRSLMQPTTTTILSKLAAMLLRHGRKAYVGKALTGSLIRLVHAPSFSDNFNYTRAHWRIFYQIFTTLRFYMTSLRSTDYTRFNAGCSMELNEFDQQTLTPFWKYSSPLNVYSNSFFHFLHDYTPIFSFLIKKVSKLQWKHSRGKSGRYTIKWKYIPLYKRVIVLLRWLVNDVQFQTHYNFTDRLYNSLRNLWFFPSSHLIIQFRQFVHKYVFQRCKNSLLKKLHSEV